MIQKIKYNRELITNKIRLQKQLSMVIEEIKKEQKSCTHIPTMVYNGEICCILCGKTVNDVEDYIDTREDKTLSIDEPYGNYLKNRITHLQEKVMLLIEKKPNITSEEIFEILKKKEKANQKLKNKKERFLCLKD